MDQGSSSSSSFTNYKLVE
ncbi:hypothetical protein VULLAG_LOCUS7793 [Vulpes lagopus]